MSTSGCGLVIPWSIPHSVVYSEGHPPIGATVTDTRDIGIVTGTISATVA